MPAGGGTTRGRAKVLAHTPARAPQPAPRHYQGPPPTSYHAAQQAQRRAVPQPQRTLRRVTTGRKVSLPAPQQSALQARRQALFHLLFQSGPPPSPDRTTGRELAGFASSAFDKYMAQANGFQPSAAGAKFAGYGTQAGNPKQQVFAEKMRATRGSDPLRAIAKALGASPVGQVAGDVQANRTWAKLAPLFGRDPAKPPPTTFANTGPKAIGLQYGGRVELDPSLLSRVLLGGKDVVQTAAHEYAHTQQAGAGSGPKAKAEGGARAFEDAVAPLLGYRPNSYRGAKDTYGNWARQNFTKVNQAGLEPDLRKILIAQFPRAAFRSTPVRAQRRNLAQ